MSKRASGPLTKSEQMARVRSKNTAAEVQLRRALWGAGLRYRLHVRLPGTPDIAFIGPRVAVFVDGCFWHGCPLHYTSPANNAEFWASKLRRNVARDRAADSALVANGWTPVRVWAHELREPERVVARVLAALALRGRAPPAADARDPVDVVVGDESDRPQVERT